MTLTNDVMIACNLRSQVTGSILITVDSLEAIKTDDLPAIYENARQAGVAGALHEYLYVMRPDLRTECLRLNGIQIIDELRHHIFRKP